MVIRMKATNREQLKFVISVVLSTDWCDDPECDDWGERLASWEGEGDAFQSSFCEGKKVVSLVGNNTPRMGWPKAEKR